MRRELTVTPAGGQSKWEDVDGDDDDRFSEPTVKTILILGLNCVELDAFSEASINYNRKKRLVEMENEISFLQKEMKGEPRIQKIMDQITFILCVTKAIV